jgi:mRNA interferase RelE/StbE
MYDVCFTDTSIRQLKKLEKDLQRRIISAIERIRIRPESFVRRLVGEPYFRLRVGDYRVILDINHRKMTIIILYVEHRKKIYKRYKY